MVGKWKLFGIVVLISLGLLIPSPGVKGITPSPSLDSLDFSITTDKKEYAPGEEVTFSLILENRGNSDLTLRFSTSQVYDIQISGPGSYFWRWSKDRFFAQVITEIRLRPGERKEFQESWKTGENFAPGEYLVTAWLLVPEGKFEAKTEIKLGSEGAIKTVVLVSDPSGAMIKIEAVNPQIKEKFKEMLSGELELWVGGRVVKDLTVNPPWHFYFDPQTIEIAEVTAEGLQAVFLRTIENDLDYWAGLSTTYISGKVVSIFDSPPFKDISENWAYPLILMLFSKGIVDGFPDGNFYPEKSLTRAEFIKILMEALKPPIPLIYVQNPTFSDVPFSHWASSYVENAALLGWVKGFPDGTFRPEDPLTKEQVLTFIVRAGNLKAETPKRATFPDLQAEHWAFPYVETAVQHGLIGVNDFNLTNSLFGTGLPSTRSQVCLIMVRFLFFF